MRITRETLQKVIRDTVTQRTRSDRSVIAVYLCGSMLEEEYLLGGSGDIDLVMIHTDWAGKEREVVRLTDEVSLDISHHRHKDYRQPRSLRIHPWQGPTINAAQVLYDPQHLMDFTQATVRGQFFRSDFVMARAGKQVEHARQIWAGYYETQLLAGPEEVSDYLRSIEHAVNGVALLSGAPLTERRFLLNFAERAEAADHPGLYAGLLGLLGAPRVDREALAAWLPEWEAAYAALPEDNFPSRLHPQRRLYYQNALSALLGSENPERMLWPLVRTWTHAVQALPAGGREREAWTQAFERLGLAGKGFQERIAALDAFLDVIEETLDEWARANGAE